MAYVYDVILIILIDTMRVTELTALAEYRLDSETNSYFVKEDLKNSFSYKSIAILFPFFNVLLQWLKDNRKKCNNGRMTIALIYLNNTFR